MSKPSAKPDRQVIQAPRFGKAKKRLPAAAQLSVDEAVRGIQAEPRSGDPKTGALKGVRVVKFKVNQQQLLLAYQFDARRNIIEVLDVGPHENFYRELQKYMDAR
ncbi:MAG TPA: type II toxin-antitoxin system RelE/ParE family toxin [Methylomirabilota bacterium]|nr:type II toxin-antitoxin system RelE/ParE family toxin [Methylomirabilota bacterium]